MKSYTYYPGCSSEATAVGLDVSSRSIAEALGMELKELEDWNCCGSTPYGSLDELEAIVVAARNLALAEKTGLDMVTPCSSCFVTLNKARVHMMDKPQLKAKVNEALAAANLEYKGTVKVRLLIEALMNDLTAEVITSKVKKPLTGLKVAPYTGCQEVRPRFGFDDPENPIALDTIVEAVGADAVPYPSKCKCCGGSAVIAEEGLCLELMYKLLDDAAKNGAECIVTPCPLCQMNLDAYQSKVNSKYNTKFNLPVLFVTQLIGVALGIKQDKLGLKKNIVNPNKVLAKYL
ncbi:MAG: CoB--CoM heterodisulfide reductase iron-sulfur subunit B family protein [Dehalococcoidales bacterium]|jgi:heterodisulfide reductase subunit B|nr:CoB--CoM heterodisulfide reductase iron-sulfur subunit B family protein [Dehalococcoidales bacterium]